MKINKALLPLLACALLMLACQYIVLPDDLGDSGSSASKGWTAVATNVGKADSGDLRIDLTLRNETGDWSAMQATASKPAVITTGAGATTNCDTVFVGTGGHRLAPGFQIRGYTAGSKATPKTQLIYVECKDAEAGPGSKLSIDYSYVTGEYNYYDQEANKAGGKLEIDLDQVSNDLNYPVASVVDGIIQKPDAKITAINQVILTLTGIERMDTGIKFSWQTSNPGEYPSYVHIGNPPVIGADGIIYGLYESPDLASTPIAGAGKTAEWTTQVSVPKDVQSLYILLSVESKKQRLFQNYAIDITSQ
jgi:hypothetical protein